MRKAIIIIPPLLFACSVTKNRNFNESQANSELQKESESSSLQKENEVKGSYQHDNDSNSIHISFGEVALDSAFNVYPFNFSHTPLPLEYIQDNWIRIYPDGLIEAKGNIKDVWSNNKKETTKKDSTNRQSLDSNSHKENLKYITKTITVTKTLLVERKPDYWGITKWVGGIVTVILLGLWLYKKWMQRFTIIP